MAKKPPAHTGGWGGLGNKQFPGGTRGGGGGGGSGQHHKRAQHHKHTGGFGGLGNTKFPKGKAAKKPPVKPGGVVKRAKHHPKRHLAGPALGGWWITGGNDTADNCAAVAVANSLLLSSGLRVSDGELLRLHDRAGPLSIPEALEALAQARRAPAAEPLRACGLVGAGHPSLSVHEVTGRAAEEALTVAAGQQASHAALAGPVGAHLGLAFAHALILGVETPHGPHAALIIGDALVTWGGVMDWPDDWLLDEAWSVTWCSRTRPRSARPSPRSPSTTAR